MTETERMGYVSNTSKSAVQCPTLRIMYNAHGIYTSHHKVLIKLN